MKMITLLVALVGAILLTHNQGQAQTAATSKTEPAKPAAKEVLSAAHTAELREIQLDIERAQSAVKDAKLAVIDKEKDLNTAVQKANTDITKLLEAAHCKGCQLSESTTPDGKKQIDLTRPPVEAAKK